MISWSKKQKLDELYDGVKDADTASVAEVLFQYVLFIQSDQELDSLVRQNMHSLKGLFANETRSFYQVVGKGVSSEDPELVEVFCRKDNPIKYLNLKEDCGAVASKINTIVSGAKVENDKERIIFDVKNYSLMSEEYPNKVVDFGKGGKITNQFQILRVLKRTRSPMTAVQVSQEVGYETDSDKVRRAFPDINRKVSEVFGADLIITVVGSQRPKRYELNPNFDFS